MKNIKFALVIISCVTIFTSCTIKGSLKGLYSYYKSTKAADPKLFIKAKADSLCYYTNENPNSKIVIVNGKDLKRCINQKEKALIYVWGPKCTSKVCFPVEVVQSYCNSKNIDLFVVAEYYDLEQMQITHDIKRPIFGIDTEYYKTSLTDKYVSLFSKDIGIMDNTYNRYYYFKDGVFLNSYESIYDLK
jgi:hypothetical protein